MKTPRSSALPQLLLLGLMALCIDAYKPVIIVHGILDGPTEFRNLTQFITSYSAEFIDEAETKNISDWEFCLMQNFDDLIRIFLKAHSGTRVKVIDLFNYKSSLMPMWKQVDRIRKEIRKEMQAAPDGIHLLCFSQGGLICRALLATTPKHNVHTFISLSSPLAGQFGETDYIKWVIKAKIFHFCYTKFGQEVSICDYWKDPHQRLLYLKSNNFLALLDGEKPHSQLGAWRTNFLRLKKLVLIGGPDDGVITPWQSSQFGFYDISENVVNMIDRDVYRNDTFGLRTLDKLGALVPCVLPGVKHVYWHKDRLVFTTCIEKWLI